MKNKWLMGLLWLLLPLNLYAAAHTIDHIAITQTGTTSRIIFSVNHAKLLHVFSLQAPHRLVLDFENSQLKASIKKIPKNNMITQIREGHPQPSILRMVC